MGGTPEKGAYRSDVSTVNLSVEECRALAQKIRGQEKITDPELMLPAMLYGFGYAGVESMRFEIETIYDEIFHTGVHDRTIDEG